MVDNEIIKALEFHANILQHGEEESLYAQALELIKYQQEKIELLSKENDELFDSYTQTVWHQKRLVNKAIKEFAERLKASPKRYRMDYTIDCNFPPISQMVLFMDDNDIDNLVREMTGGAE